jgi:PHS family inorganic phosphate transporter-like MFS transporter
MSSEHSIQEEEKDAIAGKHYPAITLDERRRAALEEVDNAKFSWFHVKVCLVAGVGYVLSSFFVCVGSVAD